MTFGDPTPVFEPRRFDDPSKDPSGSVLDLVLSVPAALAHVVVAVLRRPVKTGMDLVALVRR